MMSLVSVLDFGISHSLIRGQLYLSYQLYRISAGVSYFGDCEDEQSMCGTEVWESFLAFYRFY